jgi:hypothetical protein
MGTKPSKEVLRLQAIVDDLEAQLAKARERLADAIKAEYPFQPGSVVLVNRHWKDSFVGRVQCLNVRHGQIEMEVGKRLKGGDFSTFGTTVRPWYMTVEPYQDDPVSS